MNKNEGLENVSLNTDELLEKLSDIGQPSPSHSHSLDDKQKTTITNKASGQGPKTKPAFAQLVIWGSCLLAFATVAINSIAPSAKKIGLGVDSEAVSTRKPPSEKCKDNPFRCKIGAGALDGWYFVVSRDTIEPTYAITVEDGNVTGDFSEDKFGFSCMGRHCNESEMHSYAGRNEYKTLNAKQISRLTPNGEQHVLTWYKPLD